MRLLITNSREEQSYLILRSLRHEAERIVVTVEEGKLFRRWFNSPVWSRQVSKRYTAPNCTANWRSGRIERITNPLNRGLFSDPLPALVRTVRTLVKAIMRRLP